jgi:hypothetical protein
LPGHRRFSLGLAAPPSLAQLSDKFSRKTVNPGLIASRAALVTTPPYSYVGLFDIRQSWDRDDNVSSAADCNYFDTKVNHSNLRKSGSASDSEQSGQPK